MKIAVLSDIHDNIWALEKVLAATSGAEIMIFCGDFCAPFTLTQLGEGFQGPVHAVWGNNDGDKWLLTKNASLLGNVNLYGDFAELEIHGQKVAVNHYPRIGASLAKSGQYDAIFYGHDHTAHIEQVEGCMLVNPGEVMGRFGKSSFALYDTKTRSCEIVQIAQ